MAATNFELDEIKVEIRRAYEAGVATFKQLSKQFNIKEGTIKSWASREKWVKGKKGHSVKQQQLKKKEKVATKTEKVKDATQENADATLKSKKEKVAAKVKKENKKGATKKSPKNKYQIQKYVKPNEPEKLTEKEELFCLYYVRNFNATQAYLRAFECNYNTANAEGYKLLVKPCVRAEIDRLKELRYESIRINADDLIEKHMRIAFAEITDFADFGQIEVPLISNGKPVMISRPVINMQTGQEEERRVPLTKVVNDMRFKESTEVDGSLIKSIKVGKDGASIELLDPQKSMEWLERYFMWNPMDKHKVDFDKAKLKIDQERVNIEREALSIKNKTGSAIQEAIVNAQAQTQTLANLLNKAQPNRNIESFEKDD